MYEMLLPYKMKYWQEYYLAKCIEKHFGEINIGDLGEKDNPFQ